MGGRAALRGLALVLLTVGATAQGVCSPGCGPGGSRAGDSCGSNSDCFFSGCTCAAPGTHQTSSGGGITPSPSPSPYGDDPFPGSSSGGLIVPLVAGAGGFFLIAMFCIFYGHKKHKYKKGKKGKKGKGGYNPGYSSGGQQQLQRLDPQMIYTSKDQWTDSFSYKGSRCGTPLFPGRGDGVCDAAGIKIIGDVDPSDVNQGAVGDCWLLSAIASLAEFDGAVAQLFRKTPGLGAMPRGDRMNVYTITVWDIRTWREVDIVIDERLAGHQRNRGVLGCKPSRDHELWACYLEKALVAHCGGWDNVNGSFCVHGWAMLTGCKEQYLIKKRPDGSWQPTHKVGSFPDNSNKGWASNKSEWAAWPAYGSVPAAQGSCDEKMLFNRMCHWDDHNFLMGASSLGHDDTHQSGGIVDGHAYSVLTCVENVCNEGMDLVKVRNPWGHKELGTGEWSDSGPGWKRHPNVKQLLKPVKADDGIFWLSRQEFFQHFKAVYLCPKDLGSKKFAPAVAWPYQPMGQQQMGMQQQGMQQQQMAMASAMPMQQQGMATAMPMQQQGMATAMPMQQQGMATAMPMQQQQMQGMSPFQQQQQQFQQQQMQQQQQGMATAMPMGTNQV